MVAYASCSGKNNTLYQYFTQAEMGRLRAAGYDEAFTSLEDGIRDYVQNYLHTADPYL